MAEWSDAPGVLVFADTPDGGVAADGAVLAHGGRVVATLSLDRALDRLGQQVSVDLVILDVTRDHGVMLDHLFRAVEEGVAARRFSAVVVIVPELLDAATARIGDRGVTMMVGRDVAGLSEAVRDKLKRPDPQLRDPIEGEGLRSLSFLLDEAVRLGRTLGGGSGEDGGASSSAEMAEEVVPPRIEQLRPNDALAIREVIRARRLRDELFGQGLFADPAWDILLDLTAARIEGRAVAVSSLCIAAAVPATTALRWIKQLTEEGLLQRVADPDDGRRVFIELTDRAASIMMTFFASAARAARA